MKVSICLLALLAGLASASSGQGGWKSGYEYTYKVKSRTMVGLEGQEQQYAGVELKTSSLRVQVRDPNTLVVKAEGIRLHKIHDSLDSWLDQDADSEQLQDADTSGLEQPFVMHMDKGTVKSMLVSGRITPEAANIQKALASALQMDLQETNAIDRASKHANQLTGLGSKSDRVIYRTMEDAINGECETLYDISALPKHMVKEDPSQIPVPEACPGSNYFEVIATTNFSNCKNRPTINFAAPVQIKGTPGTARIGDYWNRAESTRYTICGKGRQDYVIQSIESKEVVAVDPFGYSTEEQLTAGSSLNLTLRDVKPISSPVQSPSDAVTLSELAFEYPEPEVDSQSPNRMGAANPFTTTRYTRSTGSHGRHGSQSNDDDDDDGQDQDQQDRRSGKHQQQQQNRRGQSSNGQSDSDFDNSDESDESYDQSRRYQSGKTFHPRSLYMRSQSGRGSQRNGKQSSSGGQPDLTSSPMIPLLKFGVTGSSSKFPGSSQIKNIAVKLAQEIADDLEDPSEMPQKSTAAKVFQLSRAIGMLSYEQIKQAAQQIKEQHGGSSSSSQSGKHNQSGSGQQNQSGSGQQNQYGSGQQSQSGSGKQSQSGSGKQNQADQQQQTHQAAQQIFLDCALISGTNPAIMWVKDLVESREIKGEQAAQALMTIPRYAKTPTKELINELYELVKQLKSVGEHQDQVETTALLAWSNLIQKACMNPQARKTKYAKAQFGSFCSPRTSEISQKWVPALAQRLQEAQTTYEEAVIIKALGNIGHESIIKALKPYISGQNKDAANHVRVKAIFALKNIVLPNSHYSKNEPEIQQAAQDALTTIFSSPGEQYEVRMAAFSLLTYSNAPFSVWQKAALRTWFEQDNQVNSFVYSTLKNLANLDDPKHYDIGKKAAQALKLAMPVQQSASFSQNYFSSNEVDDWNLAYFNQLAWFGGRSALPGNVYFRNNVQAGGMSKTPLEVKFNASAIAQLINEAFSGDEDESKYPELAKLTRQLNIESREDGPAEASAFIQFRGMQRMFPIDDSLTPALEKIAKILGEGPSSAEGSRQINYQKAIMVSDIMISIPTVTGIPIVWDLKSPAILSVQGRAKYEAKEGKVQATATLKPVYLRRQRASISFVEPLSLQRFSAGVRKHYQAYVPLKISAQIDAQKQTASIAVKPGGDDDSKSIKVLHFHVRPFTSIKKMGDFKPITKSGDVKNIHYQQNAKTHEATVGQKSTGLKFKIQATEEQLQKGFAAWFERISKHSPMSALNFWSESPSLSPREYNVHFEQEQSETDEIKAQIQISTATKKGGKSEVQSTPQSRMHKIAHEYSAKHYRSVRSLESVSAGHAVTVEAELELKSSQGQGKKSYSAAVTVAKGRNSLNEKLSVHLESAGQGGQQWELCLDSQAKFPDLPSYNYKKTIEQQVQAKAGAQISWGQQCSQSQPQIKVKVDMQRSEGQTKFAQQSEEAQQCEQDNQNGQHLTPSCKNATLHAATLNEYDIEIQYDLQSLPDSLRNATHRIEDFATAYFYPYAQQNRLHVKNEQNKIQIHAKVHPTPQDQEDILDVQIQRPQANIQFNGIKLSDETETIFPLNARQSLKERISDYILDGNDESKCTVERQNFVTFDNVSYEAELSQDNYHLLTKDCSGNAFFAVLAKEEQSGQGEKKIKILIGNTEVKLSNQGTSSQQPPKAEVNGQEVQVEPESPVEINDENGDEKVRLTATKDGYIRVVAPQEGINVKTDGKRIIIQASQWHSSNLCGLCGDFNGEQSADLQTPEQCVESPEDADDFVASYEVTESGQKSSRRSHSQQGNQQGSGSDSDNDSDESREGESQSDRNQRRQNNKRRQSRRNQAVKGCIKEKDLVVAQSAAALEGHQQFGGHQQQHKQQQQGGKHHGISRRDSGDDSDEDDSNENDDDDNQGNQGNQGSQSGRQSTQLRHKVVSRQGQKCFSTKQVPQCKSGKAPKKTFQKQVDFICVEAGPKSQRLQQECQQGQDVSQELQELRERTSADKYTQHLYLPTKCH